jgi:hypothetical protein
MRVRWLGSAVVCLAAACAVAGSLAARRPATDERTTRAVVLIVADGLRWQEVFTGADALLLNSKNGGIWAKPEELKRAYWRETAEERRMALLPFFWSVAAKQGQLYGNKTKGSVARVTNGLAFSYPGYNEMLTGRADPRINSNEFGPNPNATVFEWLNGREEFHSRVAVFATWGTFKNIFNQPRSGLDVHAGWELPYTGGGLTPREELVNDLYRHTTRLDEATCMIPFSRFPCWTT